MPFCNPLSFRRICPRAGVVPIVAWVLFLPAAPRSGVAQSGAAVFPAGQEEVVADALGRGAILPGACSFHGGTINRSVVRATYNCQDGLLVLALYHPEAVAAAQARSDRFAIVVESGATPPGFLDALTQRIRSHEGTLQWRQIQPRGRLETLLLAGVIGFPLLTVLLATAIAWRSFPRRGSTQLRPQGSWLLAIRGVGLLLIFFGSYRAALAEASSVEVGLAVFAGTFSLVAFLWLAITGCYGYGSVQRSDWVGLIPFVIALVLREMFTVHSLQEIDIQFAHGPVGRHTVVYPLLQIFFGAFVADTQAFTMHMNGWLGAAAVLASYLFVRQRLRSRQAGFLCASFLAFSPLATRFSPTDGPYALLLASWLSGLALLSAPRLAGHGLLGGAALVGIAATSRMEGLVFLMASLLMLDLRTLLATVRRDPLVAALSVSIVTTLAAVQMYFLLPFHLRNGPLLLVGQIVEEVLWPVTFHGPIFAGLVAVAAMSGLFVRHRFGTLTFLAMLLVIAPVTHSSQSIVTLHRLIPAIALLALLAGIGAHIIVAWLPGAARWQWAGTALGMLGALHPLLLHKEVLSKPYVFTEEYDLLRRHLVRNGVARSECTLLAFNFNVACDVDIHDFTPALPGMKVQDCRASDCLAAVAEGGCFFYMRSVAGYYHDDAAPAACRTSGITESGDRLPCLNRPTAAFERAVKLTPVETRSIDIHGTFSELTEHYPQKAEIGLFLVGTVLPTAHESMQNVQAEEPAE